MELRKVHHEIKMPHSHLRLTRSEESRPSPTAIILQYLMTCSLAILRWLSDQVVVPTLGIVAGMCPMQKGEVAIDNLPRSEDILARSE
jgi:hypothetical protein